MSGDGFGQVVGRSLTAFRSNILPRRVFNDFGVVWIMMALRYPQIYTHEKYNYLDRVNPSYREFAGEPGISDVVRPKMLTNQDVFHNESTVRNWGAIPYGNWLRTANNSAHSDYTGRDGGYPILNKVFNLEQAIINNNARDAFSSQRLRDYNSQILVDATAW